MKKAYLNSALLYSSLIICCLLCSCGKQLPSDLTKLNELSEKSLFQAKAASEKIDQDSAHEANKQSQRIQEKVEALKAEHTDKAKEFNKDLANSILQNVTKTRYFYQLTQEKQDHQDTLNSLKAKAYRGIRKITYEGTLKGMELAAQQMDKCQTDPNATKPPQQVLDFAVSTVKAFNAKSYLNPDQTIDWKLIESDLKALRTKPSDKFIYFLSLSYLLSNHTKLSLYEIELLKNNPIENQDYKYFFHIQKGLTYSWLNWKHMAALEVDKIEFDHTDSQTAEEKMAMVHLGICIFHFIEKDYEKVDRELVRVLQICPNHPITVLLTGERQAASGNYTKAAEILEELDEKIKDDWLVTKVRERAKELRDGKSQGQCLFYDKTFLTEILFRYLWEKAKSPETRDAIKKQFIAAKKYGEMLLEKSKSNMKLAD